MEIILGIRWENTALGTEFARNFCARTGSLQLGVVLVIYFTFYFIWSFREIRRIAYKDIYFQCASINQAASPLSMFEDL